MKIFLSAIMLTMAFLFGAPKQSLAITYFSGSYFTDVDHYGTYKGWVDGPHGHIEGTDNNGKTWTMDWDVINPKLNGNGDIVALTPYTTFSDFEANNTITGGTFSGYESSFLACYNDLVTQYNNGGGSSTPPGN